MKLELSTSRPVDREAAWLTLGDTDRMNRVAGNPPVTSLDIVEDAHGFPRLVGTMAGPLGPVEFEEGDVSWVHGRFFRQERSYRGHVVDRSNYVVALEPEGDGVRAHLSLEVELGDPELAAAVQQKAGQIGAAWQRVLDGLPRPGQRAARNDEPLGDAGETLAGSSIGLMRQWAQESDVEVVERVMQHLERAPASKIQRLLPFALADRWGFDRERTLVAMLQGVKSGAMELYFSVRCPRCYAALGQTESLSDVADHVGCRNCRISVDPDLAANVEVMLAPHPSIVPRAQQRFCTMFPAAAPDLQAVLVVPSEGRLEEAVDVTPGPWRVGAGGEVPDVPIQTITDGPAPDRVVWRRSATPEPTSVHVGPAAFELLNDGLGRVRVLANRVPEHDDRVPAALLSTLPEFRRLMGPQVLARDHRISVRSVAVLFTDLSGSTAMYEELGDAGAFAFVRDHFRYLREVVETHRGVVVKTIGDAVMAAFHSAESAARAALAMADGFDAWAAERDLEEPPRLKVGVHVGPALAVHTDQSGMDYFGQTVNLAARAESACEPGQVAWTDAVAAAPGVASALAEAGVEAAATEVTLKGLRHAQTLWQVRSQTLG